MKEIDELDISEFSEIGKTVVREMIERHGLSGLSSTTWREWIMHRGFGKAEMKKVVDRGFCECGDKPKGISHYWITKQLEKIGKVASKENVAEAVRSGIISKASFAKGESKRFAVLCQWCGVPNPDPNPDRRKPIEKQSGPWKFNPWTGKKL